MKIDDTRKKLFSIWGIIGFNLEACNQVSIIFVDV